MTKDDTILTPEQYLKDRIEKLQHHNALMEARFKEIATISKSYLDYGEWMAPVFKNQLKKIAEIADQPLAYAAIRDKETK